MLGLNVSTEKAGSEKTSMVLNQLWKSTLGESVSLLQSRSTSGHRECSCTAAIYENSWSTRDARRHILFYELKENYIRIQVQRKYTNRNIHLQKLQATTFGPEFDG
jgi:hypothetical protein